MRGSCLISGFDDATCRKIIKDAVGLSGKFRYSLLSETPPRNQGTNSESSVVEFEVMQDDSTRSLVRVFIKKLKLKKTESDRFHVLQTAGVPVPRLFHVETGSDLREVLVMEYCENLEGDEFDEARMREAATLAARVNAVDSDRIPSLKSVNYARLTYDWIESVQLVLSLARVGRIEGGFPEPERGAWRQLCALVRQTVRAIESMPRAVSVQTFSQWMAVSKNEPGRLVVYDLDSLVLDARFVNLATVVDAAVAMGMGENAVESIIFTYLGASQEIEPSGRRQLEEELYWCTRYRNLYALRSYLMRHLRSGKDVLDIGPVRRQIDSLLREANKMGDRLISQSTCPAGARGHEISDVFGFDREYLASVADTIYGESVRLTRARARYRQSSNTRSDSDAAIVELVCERGRIADVFVMRQRSKHLREAPHYKTLARFDVATPVLYLHTLDDEGREVLFLERIQCVDVDPGDPVQIDSLIDTVARINAIPPSAYCRNGNPRGDFVEPVYSWGRTVLEFVETGERDSESRNISVPFTRKQFENAVEALASHFRAAPLMLEFGDFQSGQFQWSESRGSVFVLSLKGFRLAPRFLTISTIIEHLQYPTECCWTARALGEIYLERYAQRSQVEVSFEQLRTEASACLAALKLRQLSCSLNEQEVSLGVKDFYTRQRSAFEYVLRWPSTLEQARGTAYVSAG